MTREDWLIKALTHLTKDFKAHGYTVPTVRVSVGLPSGGKRKLHTTIGQHWAPQASIDNIGSIFISPTIDDATTVLSTLVHEMVHAAVGNDQGHGKMFKRCATLLGLTGKMRATTATDGLKARLTDILDDIGPYPHARMDLKQSPTTKQTTRMIKMECEPCGYIARTSQTTLNTHGPAICPGCNERMEVK